MRGIMDGRLRAALFTVSLIGVSAIAADPSPAAGTPEVTPASAKTEVAPAKPAPTAAPAAAAPAPAPTDWSTPIKKPTDWLTLGADIRLRHEFLENVNTLNGDYPNDIASYQRYRFRVWGSITPMDNVAVNARVSDEMRYWYEPQSQIDANDGQFYGSYAIIDQLNVTMKNLAVDKSQLTVGRQDVFLLDGWLIGDGTPLDGSRTVFFDGIRYQVPLKDIKSNIDVALLASHSTPDAWVTCFGPSETAYGKQVFLTEQEEVGGYVDYTFKPTDALKIDGYFIVKNDNANEQASKPSNGTVYTLGARVENKFSENIKGRIEGAYQFSDDYNQGAYANDNGDLSAFGITSKVTYAFNDSMKNEVGLICEYLSGDDPGSSSNQAFVPLWSRYPQWSELWTANASNETRPGEVTNLIRVGPTWAASPTQKLSLSAAYYALWAPQNTKSEGTTVGGQPYYDDGDFRGHLIQGILRYKFDSHLSGHLWAEYFVPGGFYTGNRQDNAIFLRAEIVLTL